MPLFKSRNRRNYVFIVLIVALGTLNLCFYLALSDVIHIVAGRGLQAGIDLILFIMVIMGGRVIPMFTANAIPAIKPRRLVWRNLNLPRYSYP